MTESRVPPLPMEQWSDEMWEAISVIGAKRPEAGAKTGPASNILGIYANHPDLVRGWMPFSSHLKHSALPDRVREMIIVRTTWLGGGEYEWAQHRRLAQNAGLSEAEVDALSDGDPVEWSDADRAVISAVDEMHTARNIDDDTWGRLAEQFDRRQLIDFVFTAATYDMHCLAFNTLGLQLDPGLTGFPERRAAAPVPEPPSQR
ncbi:carboxymuconolactone decarboxylase family protein [Leucobacter weissii]|uniref:Carboxymuconolactone decarboxylase family protein n=1 Tax=Leucobacter weissii TaxID=1983706 RepID=A0A939MMH5_9MICO|nr:carboxymuconolactone decarboxylase family protein [Leucobacter weissii]MBO1901327.1 carboxymuconolactone decarboxylase family protein [Leucobacter weissii]